jgi:uncharacterized protein YbjT (DUF2867 family)
MKILLTGANGYIGKRLLPVLLNAGHRVYCCVRNRNRFIVPGGRESDVEVLEMDFSNPESLAGIPADIDAAYYLIHSMAASVRDFSSLEAESARNFTAGISKTKAQQVIFLSGIANDDHLSPHLQSRSRVEEILKQGSVPVTILRAGIIVGSGSASFEIIRDLAEKLPVMVAPRWINTKSQPIAIRDVIRYLSEVLLDSRFYHRTFDIGGPEVLTYREMLLRYAEVRKLRRTIIALPVLSPRLSSYWLFFVTSTSYPLAVNLVESMKNEVVCRDHELEDILQINPIPYREAVRHAFQRIEQNMVVSSWTDSFTSSAISAAQLQEYIQVPKYGCFVDRQVRTLRQNPDQVLQNIWSIGGRRGWYYANFLWRIRGYIDKLAGGVGLRRGRRSLTDIHPGDALDFWRVLVSDRINRRLLLYAEMKLPGEAWLEFRIEQDAGGPGRLVQQATFRPNGLFGRLYWYALYPAHFFVFGGMARNIARFRRS